jgi:sugar-specific transcriptional regulator TrmB
MYLNELIQFGLTKTQAEVLDFLLENGENRVREIAKAIKHPRGVVYKSLEELIRLELAEKTEKDKEIAKFRASHPRNIEKILEEKEKILKQNKKIFSEVLPMLSSSYNLTISKPGVKFYEGEEGLRKILFDTLSSKTEIYSIINDESIQGENKFKEINEEYIRRREKKGIVKKIIIFGEKIASDFDKEEEYQRITQVKYAKSPTSFKSVIQIYDNKISFQIIEGEKLISVLMEDKNIYGMQKTFFETLWNLLTSEDKVRTDTESTQTGAESSNNL